MKKIFIGFFIIIGLILGISILSAFLLKDKIKTKFDMALNLYTSNINQALAQLNVNIKEKYGLNIDLKIETSNSSCLGTFNVSCRLDNVKIKNDNKDVVIMEDIDFTLTSISLNSINVRTNINKINYPNLSDINSSLKNENLILFTISAEIQRELLNLIPKSILINNKITIINRESGELDASSNAEFQNGIMNVGFKSKIRIKNEELKNKNILDTFDTMATMKQENNYVAIDEMELYLLNNDIQSFLYKLTNIALDKLSKEQKALFFAQIGNKNDTLNKADFEKAVSSFRVLSATIALNPEQNTESQLMLGFIASAFDVWEKKANTVVVVMNSKKEMPYVNTFDLRNSTEILDNLYELYEVKILAK